MKKTVLCVLCILLSFAFVMPFSSCRNEERQEKNFFFMNTPISVTLYTDRKTAERIFDDCRQILSTYDALWSRTVAESDIGRFNIAKNALKIDGCTASLITQAIDVSQKTDGAFDITVAPIINLWQACEERGTLPTNGEMQAALSLVGSQNIALSGNVLTKSEQDVQIDLGGIGKGAAISALIEYLERCDIRGGLVSFGSNVAVFGGKPDGEPYRIALKNPKTENGYAGILKLQAGQVLAVSGDYERYYSIDGKKYHHIIDPQTGYPSESGLCSVAVICSNGALADALSTALFVMGEEVARSFYESKVYDFEAIFIGQNGNVTVTAGLADSFETKKS